MSKIPSILLFNKVALIVCLLSQSVKAMDFERDFTLGSSVDFDTNPAMTEEKSSNFRYGITPGMRFKGSSELTTINLNMALLMQKSSNENLAQNRRDPNVSMVFARELEKGRMSVNANYLKSSIRTSELTQSGVVFLDGSSISRSLNADFNYLLNDRLTWSNGAGYLKLDYSNSGPQLTSFDNRSFYTKLSYLYSEKLTPFSQFSYSKFEQQDTLSDSLSLGLGRKSTSRNLTFGYIYQYAPKIDYTVSAGVNRVSNAGSGWVAATSLNYAWDEKSMLTASAARSISPSGLGGFQKSDNLNLSYVRERDAHNTYGMDFNWTKNRTINDIKAIQLTGWISRELSQDWTARLTLQQRLLDVGNQSSNGNLIAISINYNKLNF